MTSLKQEQFFDNAKKQLVFARTRYPRLVTCGCGYELEKHWADFVGDWGRSQKFLYLSLNCKRTKKLQDRLVNERKTDKVVQFLFQSRDAKEHTAKFVDYEPVDIEVRSSTGRPLVKGTEALGISTNFRMIGCAEVTASGEVQALPDVVGTISEDGCFIGNLTDDRVQISPPKLVLVPVTTRSGTYGVPYENSPAGQRPLEIAKYGLNYLGEAIKEAESLFFD